MNKTLRKVLPCLLLLVATTALPAASPWSVRLRATYLETVDKSDAFSALGIAFAPNAVSVSDKLIPEIDVAYAFTDTLSAELVLTIPQEHSVSLAGVGRLGSFKHLPPTLLFQYRALPGAAIRPYVAAGVNFTLIWDDRLVVAGVPLRLENNSTGLALQAGVDWKLDERWSFNLDLKRAYIRSGVYAGAARLTEARLDPWLYAAGVRYEF
ncbi:Outer membrane protein W precursor [Lacunisphaera limnophila]|uniref:Outer membrane protein W n=1 Tax=Lacunisphaera limnophila TaxID=1838286 RepID=A0A1D8ARG7_9BACT|nr:OmpW family outer membrane protein [Lacunisphaera limnophila]AOS43470.1 Outer membrane protein W precursor [Lacunisphaera limnophila]